MTARDPMAEIHPDKVLYIKLGRSGEWESECLFGKPPSLRIGFKEVSHEDCIAKRWDVVELQEANERSDNKGSVTRGVNQIKAFYDAGENVLWVTFHSGRLWWCFSKPEVTGLIDGSKRRPVIGGWRDTDIQGKPLSVERLRGSLLSMQGYRETICSVRESEYVVDKINARSLPQVEQARTAHTELMEKIAFLVKGLHPRDFELLVDLIFREAGWKRIGEVGGSQKTLDLELLSPITNERIGVQVKTSSNRAEYLDYERRFGEMEGYSKFFYIVHTPAKDLEDCVPSSDDVKIIGPKDVARMCIEYGLAEWIMAKAD